jgi:hypothetical protein
MEEKSCPVLTSAAVVAAVLMGDPRFTKGMKFNKGTAKGGGVCSPYLFPNEIIDVCMMER